MQGEPLSGFVGLLLVVFFLIVGILAFLMPFFILRIRNEIVVMNHKLSRIIELMEKRAS